MSWKFFETIRSGLLLMAFTACLGARDTTPPVDNPPGDDTGETGPTEPAANPLREGSYAGDTCFLNKMATAGFGADVYSTAAMSFDSTGAGQNTFQLYTDELCQTPVLDGVVNIQVTLETRYGDVLVFKMVQEDPSIVDDEPQTFYLTAVIDGADYILDLEARNGVSGPYLEVPSATEVAAFASDPVGLGVRFRKQ